jgi:2OG-Fe(II) oxygenase superfamily
MLQGRFGQRFGRHGLPAVHPSSATGLIPTVDINSASQQDVQQLISHAATTSGLLFIRGLPMYPDFSVIQRLFDSLYQSSIMAARLNRMQPGRGVFNLAGKWMGDGEVDDKATIGISAHTLRNVPNQVKQSLGPDFLQIVAFFEAVQAQLIPVVLQVTSDVISSGSSSGENDLWNLHREGNYNFRLIDYHRSPSSNLQGAREHRDPGTATIIFQDGSGGLEIQHSQTGEWIAVPPNETVIMWGSCGHILSGGRIHAVNHRVRPIPSARRNVAVCFISPDLDAVLTPLAPSQRFFPAPVMNGQITVRRFREMRQGERRWREPQRNQ